LSKTDDYQNKIVADDLNISIAQPTADRANLAINQVPRLLKLFVCGTASIPWAVRLR